MRLPNVKARLWLTSAAALCALPTVTVSTASAATWTGSARGKIDREAPLVSGIVTWHGDFRFTTSRSGAVRGHAVVAYEPSIDASGLNGAIGYVRDVAGAALDVLGRFGPAVSGTALGQIVGTSVSFREPMAVREGPLTGQLTCTARTRTGRCLTGRLKLEWQPKLAPIAYNIYLQLATGEKQIGSESIGLRSPFDKPADVSTDGHAVSVYRPQPTDPKTNGGVRQKVGSYWVADRVN
jgi:hypothetical protein